MYDRYAWDSSSSSQAYSDADMRKALYAVYTAFISRRRLSGSVTLHGGPVRLRPVRATHYCTCLGHLYVKCCSGLM